MNALALQHVQNNKMNQYRKNPIELLKWITNNLPNKRVVMGTGFGPPGIVLLDMLFQVTQDISVFPIQAVFDALHKALLPTKDTFGKASKSSLQTSC